MADEARYGRSERGRETLIYCGFEFCRHRVKANGHVVWRCSKCRALKCKAIVEAEGLRVVGTSDVEHNHEGNLSTAALARMAMKGEMKKRVVDTSSKPSVVPAAVASQLAPDVLMSQRQLYYG